MASSKELLGIKTHSTRCAGAFRVPPGPYTKPLVPAPDVPVAAPSLTNPGGVTTTSNLSGLVTGRT